MIKKRFVSRLSLHTEEEQYVAMLTYMLLVMLSVSLVFTVISYFSDERYTGTIASGTAVLASFILLYTLLRLKRVILTGTLLITYAFIVIFASLILNGGIRDEAAILLLTLLVVSSFVASRRLILPLGLISSVGILLLYIAERNDAITVDEYTDPVALHQLFVILLGIFTTTVIIYWITGQIEKRATMVQQQALSLEAQNTHLVETQNALLQAKEKAETATNTQKLLFSYLSHDLRAPVTTIQGMTSFLRDNTQLTAAERLVFLEHILTAGDHLSGLINDLVDISRLGANQLSLFKSNISLPLFLHEVIAMKRLQAEENGLQLQLRYDALPSTLYADEQRLRQVLLNLIGNAIQFTLEGSVELNVMPESGEATAVNHIRFEVIDTGIGVTPEEQERIFQPFVQAKPIRLRKDGSGLGLAISAQLVQAMGGQLHVDSQPKQGSCFWFTLPLQFD